MRPYYFLLSLPCCIGWLAHGFLPAQRPSCAARSALIRADDIDDESAGSNLNWLQTRLQIALSYEDYTEAAIIRDQIKAAAGATGGSSWGSLGLPDWLEDRLERLNFALPTRVQTHSLRALERGDDAAVCAPTGSGKTLSYLLPLLAQLSDDLLSEDLSDYLASFLDGGRGSSKKGLERRRAASGNVESNASSLEAMRVPTPAMLVVVPTRELGVQVSMLCYRLLGGGNTNPTLQPYNHPSRYQPGGKANMFSYVGPRHVKVAGLWDEQSLYATNPETGEIDQDLLMNNFKGVHVIVGTPEYLSRVGVGRQLELQNVRGLVVDEADACLSDPEQAEAMELLLRRMKEARAEANTPAPQTVLAGASLSSPLVRKAIDAGWVREPTLVSEYGWIEHGTELEALADERPSGGRSKSSSKGGAPGWDSQRVPAGHAHEYTIVEPKNSVAVLCKLLRERFETVNSETEPPRVIVFAPNADAAVKLASQLQGALFGTLSGDASAGLWGLSVLLPSAEARLESRVNDDDQTLSVLESSLRVMEMFAVNRTSVLVTTAAATRGLDFPQVTDVLNLGIVGSAADYVHRAGRVGRVGQLARGRVTSVLCAAEVPELLALGRELQFSPTEVAAPSLTDLTTEGMSQEDRVQVLADTFNLYEIAEPDDKEDA